MDKTINLAVSEVTYINFWVVTVSLQWFVIEEAQSGIL